MNDIGTLDNLVYRVDTRPVITYKLNIDKVKTLDDVIKIIEGLDIQVALYEGTTCEMYEKLKEYFE